MLLKRKSPIQQTKSYFGNGFSLYYTNGSTYLFDANLEQKALLNIYSQVEPLNSALRIKTKAMKSILPYLYDKNTDEYIINSPFIKTLMNPCHDSSYSELITEIVLHKSLTDNFYIVVKAGSETKEATELKVIRPDKMNILLYSQDGLPFEYKQDIHNLQQSFIRTGIVNPRYFNLDKTEELIHWNGINISSIHTEYRGNDGIHACYIQCLKFLRANEYNVGLLQNGARPSGALVLKAKDGCNSNLTDEQFDRLKDQLEKEYSGTYNAGKPILLEGGLEFQPMNLTSKEMDFLNGIKFDSKSIIRNIGVPLTLAGEQETTFNAYPEARVSLYEDTAIPEMQEIFDFLFSKIALPRYSKIDKYILTYKKDEIQPLANKQREINMEKARIAISSKIPILTTDELRELLGYEPSKNKEQEEEQEKAQFIRLLKNSGSYSDSDILKLVKDYKSL